MAPHSNTLAWKIPWTEEPGRLQSMGPQRVWYDWATSRSLFTFMHWRRKWQPTPVFLPGESQGQGSLMGCRLLRTLLWQLPYRPRTPSQWPDWASGPDPVLVVGTTEYASRWDLAPSGALGTESGFSAPRLREPKWEMVIPLQENETDAPRREERC